MLSQRSRLLRFPPVCSKGLRIRNCCWVEEKEKLLSAFRILVNLKAFPCVVPGNYYGEKKENEIFSPLREAKKNYPKFYQQQNRVQRRHKAFEALLPKALWLIAKIVGFARIKANVEEKFELKCLFKKLEIRSLQLWRKKSFRVINFAFIFHRSQHTPTPYMIIFPTFHLSRNLKD